MERPAFGNPPFSAEVDMWLESRWSCWPLRQVGDNFIIADGPADTPDGPAEVVMSVDGEIFRHRVMLPEGMSASQIETPTAPDDDIPF